MRSATRVGLVTVLLAAAGAGLSFFVRRPPAVRYLGRAGNVAASVALRLEGPAPPSVTIDLGNGVRVVAARMP